MSNDVQIDPEVLETFLIEANEHLGEIESRLLNFDSSVELDSDELNSLFRSFHTIKGTSEMFGYKHVSEFTHTAETLLVSVRNGEIPLTAELVEVLLKCKDHIIELLSISESDFQDRSDLREYGDSLVDILNGFGKGQTHAKTASPVKPAAAAPEIKGPVNWGIMLKFKSDLFLHGLDPFPIIRYLRNMGEIIRIKLDPKNIPTKGEFNAEKCYLIIYIKFHSEAKEKDILENFEFIQDDCDISIRNLDAKGADPSDSSFDETPSESGESLVQESSETSSEPAGTSSGEDEITPNAPVGSDAASRMAQLSSRKSEVAVDQNRVNRSFRVDSERIDHLINLVSELVMSGATIGQISSDEDSTTMIEASDQLSRIITDIRESTLRLRMVPVGGVFNRFKRVIHDLNRELEKDVNLHLRGSETELDKSVIEQITDPLMHLIRNSLDHGIESREIRQKRNKPLQGNIYLEAYNEAGDIIIEIRDDGGGLNKDRIFAKAVEKGLVDKSRAMNDAEIYSLIFEPGFSTAQKVTNISGRGVGLDVVKRNIDALNGNVGVASVEDEGTTFRIKLPLTLATIDGFLVEVRGVKYVIPLDTVSECIEFSGSDAGHQTRNIINIRGEI
ncbi:MAG: chemotaxis protein CheA, partial [Spirochaetia bacterium]|nr:chemotaxis protein CheA [Spirochaetia bacterium]